MAVQSKERLNELLEKYRLTGDMNVRNEIVLMYMDLVKMIAVSMRNIYTGYAESDDIINEGVIALMAAIDGFDPEKNVKFETYAGIRIKGAVIDYLRKLDRVPRTLRKLSKQLDDNFARLNSELCRTPTDEELAESMNMTTAQLSKLMANTAGMITLSFEELLYEANLDENISASSETADAKMYEREKKQVVTMYYYERLKYSEIAKVMSITQSRVCQIHSKAMLTLKNKLESYING